MASTGALLAGWTGVTSIFRTIFTGLLAILPIVLTLGIIGWVADALLQYLGTDSLIGRLLAGLGGTMVSDETLAFVVGAAIVLVLLYLIGLLVQTRLRVTIRSFFDRTIGRLPLIGTIYTTVSRFIGLLERREGVDLHAMRPVLCYFSDERRTAVLGLLPTADPVFIDGEEYRVVMVPTSPVPFGGGLIFLPTAWVRPAPFGIEGLTNIYVSMGVSAPDYLKRPVLVADEKPVLIRR